MTLHARISSRRTLRAALTVLLLLLVAHLIGIYLRLKGVEYLFGIVPLFDFDAEANVPTLYATILLFSCSAVLAVIGRWKRTSADRYHRHWAGLSAIFLFLGLDEILVIHEKFSQLEAVLPSDGVLHFPWVIVYGPIALVIGLLYLRFLAALPRWTAGRFVLAGALYVGGAVGMELIGAPMWAAGTEGGALYAGVATAEELFEFLGTIVFLWALLAYLERSTGLEGLSVSFGEADMDERAAHGGTPV